MVRTRLEDLAARREGRPGLVTVAYDTELFGHWWHEGPVFLEAVLRRLPEAGVRVTTLAGAVRSGHVAGDVEPGPGSWGTGKDWRVWDGQQVADLAAANSLLLKRLLDVVDATLAAGRTAAGRASTRRPDLDQLVRDALLAVASDWAFMVSKDSAAGYARDRVAGHMSDFDDLARILERSPLSTGSARPVVERQRSVDGPFAHMDARLMAGPTDV